jgi:hypothetical protein
MAQEAQRSLSNYRQAKEVPGAQKTAGAPGHFSAAYRLVVLGDTDADKRAFLQRVSVVYPRSFSKDFNPRFL